MCVSLSYIVYSYTILILPARSSRILRVGSAGQVRILAIWLRDTALRTGKRSDFTTTKHAFAPGHTHTHTRVHTQTHAHACSTSASPCCGCLALSSLSSLYLTARGTWLCPLFFVCLTLTLHCFCACSYLFHPTANILSLFDLNCLCIILF